MDIILFAYLGLAYWLYRYFVTNDRGAKEPKKALRLACIMGVVATVFAGILNDLFIPASVVSYLEDDGILAPSNATLLTSALTVGIIEESLKFLPLAFLIYRKPYFNETTDGIIYFGLCGMWFGVVESIGYALVFGPEVGFMRLLVTPFLHAGFSALAGWGLAMHKVHKTTLLVPAGLFASAIIGHGLYDFFAFTQTTTGGLIVLGMAIVTNMAVFVLFKKARASDERLGISAIGINKFCRNCGKPNPSLNLYCVNCGKKA